jgi:RNA polymerase sigma-70 factor (ECF subfamily)
MENFREGKEEQELIERLIANDRAAWQYFQHRYRLAIMHRITGITKRFAVSSDDAGEIYCELQASLLAKGAAKLRAYDRERGTPFSSYLRMLAARCTYDRLRRTRHESTREAIGEVARLKSDRPDPFEEVAHQEQAALAFRAMNSLSRRDRMFVILYFGQGMQPREIARTMKIRLNTVYSKKHKIERKLESIVLAHRGGEPRGVVRSAPHGTRSH